jgi:hypothetical protein
MKNVFSFSFSSFDIIHNFYYPRLNSEIVGCLSKLRCLPGVSRIPRSKVWGVTNWDFIFTQEVVVKSCTYVIRVAQTLLLPVCQDFLLKLQGSALLSFAVNWQMILALLRFFVHLFTFLNPSFNVILWLWVDYYYSPVGMSLIFCCVWFYANLCSFFNVFSLHLLLI